MNTLKELKVRFAKAPKMLTAVENAIADYGEETPAIVVSGLPSERKVSNLRRAANSVGWENYTYYYGAHRQRGTEGWRFIVVESK